MPFASTINLKEGKDYTVEKSVDKSSDKVPMGTPSGSHPNEIKLSHVAVLGVVEQGYGIYQIPSFRSQVQTFWDDPVLKEGITMFAEQVVATGYFLTGNAKYPQAEECLKIIKKWCKDNNIDTKLLPLAVELRAFGNSVWRIREPYGFIKVPIEALWHCGAIDAATPLQEKYHIMLTPFYKSAILRWGTFKHFRVAETGFHAPFGQGIVYGLLARPVDMYGQVCPSIYDMRLGTRSSLHEGFRKFSFGNELWCFPDMSNEDFEDKEIGKHISEMSSTGNRIASGEIKLAVPDRSEGYDEFIKQMRDEFFMAVADPSLKLGLEEGFTKATSITAGDVYKFKIATMRKTIKEGFEDLFSQLLTDLGYDGDEADICMNFGPEENATYLVADVFNAVGRGIILKNEARRILSKYQKWDITGDIKGGDEVPEPMGAMGGGTGNLRSKGEKPSAKDTETAEKGKLKGLKLKEFSGEIPIPDADKPEEQLAIGILVEMEHTDNVEKATEIARVHLKEIPDYYTRLVKMEKKAKLELHGED
jgi:hypothetical protein